MQMVWSLPYREQIFECVDTEVYTAECVYTLVRPACLYEDRRKCPKLLDGSFYGVIDVTPTFCGRCFVDECRVRGSVCIKRLLAENCA